MSETPFASATVRISPSLTSFKKDLEAQLVAIMAKVKVPPIRVRPALAVDFVGSLRKQVNVAILQAQAKTQPIRIKALIKPIGTVGPVVPAVGHIPPPVGVVGGVRGSSAVAKETAAVARAQTILGAALQKLERIESKAIAKSTQAAQANVRYKQTAQALVIAEEAHAAALKTTDTALQANTAATVERIRVGKEAFRVAQQEITAEAARVAALNKTIITTKAPRVISTAPALKLNQEAVAQLAGVEAAASLQTNKLSAARSRLAETSGAVTIAERAVEKALLSKNALTIALTENTLRLAAASEVEAEAAVHAAIAERIATQSLAERLAQMRLAAKGAAATALQQIGARGATLAASSEFLIGAAAAVAVFKSIQLAATLQKELNVFRITAGATADEMDRVGKEAKQLGADITLPGVGANDAAQAMTELAKAGLSVEDAMAAARGTLQLATAAEIDNVDATNIVANAINSFGLAGSQAAHIADLLAASSIEAQGSISDVGQALSNVAPVAKQSGVSLEDTVAMLTLLAKNGIQGAGAGTVLRVALLRLINPSKEAAGVIERLHLRIRDLNGNIRPEVFADFADKTAELSKKQRDMDAAIIFGDRGIRAQAILAREGAAGLNDMRAATARVGAAQELAGAQTQGFSGKVEALKNSLETLGITLGALTLGPLSAFIEDLTIGVGTVNRFAEAVTKLSNIKIRDFLPIAPGATGEAQKRGTDLGDIFSKAFSEAIGHGLALQFLGPGATAAIQISRILGGGEAGKASKDIQEMTTHLKEMGDTAPNISFAIDQIFKNFEEGGRGLTATNQLVIQLRQLEIELDKGGPKSKKLADEIHRLIKELQNTGNLPPVDIPIKFKPSAKEVADSFRQGFGDNLLFADIDSFFKNAVPAAKAAAEDAAAAFASTFDTQLAVAEATGAGDAVQLGILNKQLAKRQKILQRAQAKFAANPTKANDALVGRAAGLVTDTQNKIKTITNQQATDAQEQASDIKDAQQRRDTAGQKIVDAITEGRKATILQNRITAAGLTAWLGDDLKTNQAWLNYLKKMKVVMLTRLKAVGASREVISTAMKAINALIFGITNDIKKLTADQKQNMKDRREALEAIVNEKLDLRIQIAESRGNLKDQIRAHRAKLAEITDELVRARRQYGKNSIEWLRLKAAQVAEIAAINELTESQKDKNNATAAMQFEFLQTQAGFAANLLGNLIPMGATGGLLGGTTGTGGGGIKLPGVDPNPSHPFRESGGPDAALRKQGVTTPSGPSRGGQVSQTHLLREILRVLNHIYRGTGHPEAHHRRRTNPSAMSLDHLGT